MLGIGRPRGNYEEQEVSTRIAAKPEYFPFSGRTATAGTRRGPHVSFEASTLLERGMERTPTMSNSDEDDNDLGQHARELAVAAREAVNAHRRAAEAIDDDAVAQDLERLAARREALVEALDQAIWNMGELTEKPDADLETVRGLKLHLEALVHLSDSAHLIGQCRETDEKVLRAAAELDKAGDLPTELREAVRRIRDDAELASSELAALQQRL